MVTWSSLGTEISNHAFLVQPGAISGSIGLAWTFCLNTNHGRPNSSLMSPKWGKLCTKCVN